MIKIDIQKTCCGDCIFFVREIVSNWGKCKSPATFGFVRNSASLPFWNGCSYGTRILFENLK